MIRSLFLVAFVLVGMVIFINCGSDGSDSKDAGFSIRPTQGVVVTTSTPESTTDTPELVQEIISTPTPTSTPAPNFTPTSTATPTPAPTITPTPWPIPPSVTENINAPQRTENTNPETNLTIETNQTIAEEKIPQVSDYEYLIRETAQDYGIPEKLFLGLIDTESSGNPYEVSYAGAKGLTQVMDYEALECGLKISNGLDDERFIPKKVLPCAAKFIVEEYERFEEWELALWAWHIGAPRIYWAVQTHARLENGVVLPNISVVPYDNTQEALDIANTIAEGIMDQYRKYISSYEIKFNALFENEVIKAKFRGPQWNQTDKYIPRIIAFAGSYD